MPSTVSSVFHHVLHTNYAPTYEEVLKLRQLLVEPRRKLACLNEEIAHVQAILRELLLQQQQLESYIDPHEALLSPIRRFPPEVLAEIFFLCLPSDRLPVRSTSEAPLLLTGICRRWRDIALSTPRLWCALHLYLPPINDRVPDAIDHRQRRTEGAMAWLGRSGALPLSLSLVAHDRHPVSPHLYFVEFLKTLSRRFRNLYLSLPLQGYQSLESLNADDIPLLETLVVNYSHSSLTDTTELQLGNIIANAPALHKISIMYQRLRSYDLPIVWGNITELNLRSMKDACLTSGQALDVLRQASNLRCCRMYIVLPPWDEFTPYTRHTIVTLSFLSHLTVAFQHAPGPPGRLDVVVVEDFFKNLRAESLTSLQVSAPKITEIWQRVPFHFLSLQKLEMLKLKIPISCQALTQLLERVPELVSLHVNDIRTEILPGGSPTSVFEDEHLNLLTPSSGNPFPLCPRLQHLELGNCKSVSDEALLHFAKVKMSVPQEGKIQRLMSLEVSFRREMMVDVRNEMRVLKQMGLQARIAYPRGQHRSGQDVPVHGLPNMETFFLLSDGPWSLGSYEVI